MTEEKMPPEREDARRTLDDWMHTQAKVVTVPLARMLAAVHLTPNAMTIIGFALNVVAAWIVASGRLQFGGAFMLFASGLDGLDGALARLTNAQSRFGAFLDSTFDRLSEGALLLGLAAWSLTEGRTLELYLIYLTLLGSVMVSYTRARAEGLGLNCTVGLLTRPMRVALLGLALLTLWLRPILAVLTVLIWFTVFQRIVHVYRVARRA
ncbi:MAG: CDP-alcohol phosphatidyltransferase family protein [Anaerolineae bacterium]